MGTGAAAGAAGRRGRGRRLVRHDPHRVGSPAAARRRQHPRRPAVGHPGARRLRLGLRGVGPARRARRADAHRPHRPGRARLGPAVPARRVHRRVPRCDRVPRGRISVLWTVVGALFVSALANGLVLLGLGAPWRYGLNGALILLALALGVLRRRGTR
nr:hypothetical protein [Angustibacter aerolatus]